MLVVDASALIDQLFRAETTPTIEYHLLEHLGDLHAPHLIDVEVLTALRRVELRPLPTADAQQMLADFLDFPLERYPHTLLVPRVWELRHNFSVADATYVALAETLAEGTVLLTADARLARAVRKHTDVEVLLAA